MRQIQYLTQLLQQIIFKKKQNKPRQALEDIHHALKQVTKGSPKDFHELSLQETHTLFVDEHTFYDELALAVADLLVEKAELLQNRNHHQSQKSYLQALLLYRKGMNHENAVVPVDIRQKITTLKQRLQDTDLQKVDEILRHD